MQKGNAKDSKKKQGMPGKMTSTLPLQQQLPRQCTPSIVRPY
jgi:hypothetical protein